MSITTKKRVSIESLTETDLLKPLNVAEMTKICLQLHFFVPGIF